MSKTTTVTVGAKFLQMKPAHNHFIQKQGAGSNMRRAVNDAITKIYADDRLKGKRETELAPATFTVAVYKTYEEGGKDNE
jgi:hypothetical protein